MVSPPVPTPQSRHERRKLPRYQMALDVEFGPLEVTPQQSVDARLTKTVTIDLSLGGLCLYNDRAYPVGTPMRCVVTLPGRAESVTVLGTLAWFQRVDREDPGYRLGIEFTQVSERDRAALTALIDHPPTANGSRGKRVLLVDDDDELRQALKIRFESAGFQVLTAGDGLEAVKKGREERPHVIILDLMLPRLNGFEVCRLLKYDEKFRHIPVLLFTARCRREDQEMGRSVGADAYVTKPFNGKELIAKVEELLAAKRP